MHHFLRAGAPLHADGALFFLLPLLLRQHPSLQQSERELNKQTVITACSCMYMLEYKTTHVFAPLVPKRAFWG